MTKQLEVQDLRAYFNKNEALKGITMDILQNEITAIIGPSGCGKSTFIRCLNRLHETIKGATTTGVIKLENQSIFEKDPVELRRYIGMVFQKPNPFVKLSVFDNVASGLRLDGGYSKAEMEERVEKSLQMVALWDEVKDRLHTNAMGLSGGQQQRLCMARTLAIEPRVILMDEPTSALDPISTHKIEELVQELKTKYCIVIVTHNMQQASRISDKTAFFLSGNLVEFDQTAKIFSNPREQKTEEYISGRFG